MDIIKDKLAILPDKPGCYLMKNDQGEIIYVGKAKKLKNRVRQYFVGVHDFKTTKLVSHIHDFEFIVTQSEKEALLLEINLIKKHTPPYNIMFMDDKTYPYIRLGKEDAPTLKVVRKTDKKAEYFGPFPNSSAAYDTMKLLNRIYPLRKCARMPKKACLYYHMGQCLAPCEKEVDSSIYQEMKNAIRRFFKGDVKQLIDELYEQMMKYADILDFEKAQEYKELIDAIQHVTQKQQIDFKDLKDRDVFGYYVDKGYISIQAFFLRGGKLLERSFSLQPLFESEEDAFESFIVQYYQAHPYPHEILLPHSYDCEVLKEVLDGKIVQPERGDKLKLVKMVLMNAKKEHEQKFTLTQRKDDNRKIAMHQLSQLLNHDIHRIELFDNSHLQGSFNVSGMVVFVDGKASKKDYRMYRLDGYRSDLDSMKEAIYRRYFRLLKDGGTYSDLLIVDGGEQQIAVAKEILDALEIDVLLCGLCKDEHHRTSALLNQDGERFEIDVSSPLFFLLTQMQDEVHRFAIRYHRRLRSKAMSKSILDEIEGVGEVRKKAIWNHFGSLKKLKAASVEEISEIVPRQVAQSIYDVLHVDELKSELKYDTITEEKIVKD